MFGWWRRRRRAKLLATPAPAEWAAILARIPHVATLDPSDRPVHLDATRVILAETTFEGVAGLEVDETMRVTIAGLAAVLVLGLPECRFENVPSVIVSPDAYAVTHKTPLSEGVELEEVIEHLGDTQLHGAVKLSWHEIGVDLREPWAGRNLVFHEFAHQLDMLNGDADGVPLLPRELRQPWAEVMEREFAQLGRASRRRRSRTVIDPYGAEDPAEFFSVVVEAFFDAPRALQARHGELYDLLRRYFRQDPALRSGE